MKKRCFQLDFIRVVATFFIMSVHFFLKTGFYKEEIGSIISIIAIFFRSLFLTCVPLFIILSGYLLNKRTISIKHYLSLKRVLIQYVLCTILLVLLDITNDVGGGYTTLKQVLLSILNFGYYSWYIKKYIILFILIPFVNHIFKKNNVYVERLFITSLSVLICLPTFSELAGINNGFSNMILQLSNKFYPVLYYSIGVLIYKYKERISIKKSLLCIFLICVEAGSTFVAYKRFNGSVYLWETWNNYNGAFCVVTSILVFLILFNIKTNYIEKSEITNKAISSFSELSLYIYLLSYKFDNLYYPFFIKMFKLESFWSKMFLYPIVPILVFTSSYLLGYVIDIVYRFFKRFTCNLSNQSNCPK